MRLKNLLLKIFSLKEIPPCDHDGHVWEYVILDTEHRECSICERKETLMFLDVEGNYGWGFVEDPNKVRTK